MIKARVQTGMNDDTEDKDEKERREQSGERWLSATARNNRYSDDESCTNVNMFFIQREKL